jgi:Spy/CpxP family protein refolding chaperone
MADTAKETTMKRSWKIGIALAGAFVLALAAGGAALASGRMHDGFVKRRITRHIDQALDAVGATSAQRDAVHAARDHVFATIAANHEAERGDLQAALSLWESERMDPAAIATLRAHHQAAAKKTGDAVVQALSDAHDALTAPQRQQLADYLRSHKPLQQQKWADGAKPFVRHMVAERLDDMLDQIHATADQRAKVTAAVDRAFASISANFDDHAAHFDDAVAVFTADQIDQAKLASLQAARQAKMQKVGDAIVQALTEAHDALDAGQRHEVAAFVRAHHPRHGE